MSHESFRFHNQSIFSNSRRRLSVTPTKKNEQTETGGGAGDDDLLVSLRILQRYRKIQFTKQSYSASFGKRGTSIAGDHEDFTFTNNMFCRSNSEALVQVTYQIFSTAFPTETFTKFRTCYPTNGDRKLESEYRKVAFTWVLEIYEKYPQFFDTKPQFAYFVAPSGSKCSRFLATLAKCGLFVLAERIQAAKGKQLIEKPNYSANAVSRATNMKDISIFNETMTNNCIQLVKQIAQFAIYMEQTKADHDAEEVSISQIREDQESSVRELIIKRPELFPENSLAMLHSTTRMYTTDGRDFAEEMLVYRTETEVGDKLICNLKEEWKQRLMLLRGEYETLEGFIAQHKNLMQHLEEIVRNYHLVINLKDYPGLLKASLPSSQSAIDSLPDVGHYLAQLPSLFNTVADIFVDHSDRQDNGQPTINIVDNVRKIIDEKHSLVEEATLVLANIPKINIDDLRFGIKVEQMAMEGTDWNGLLPKTTTSAINVNHALRLTPIKPRDFTRITGLTPIFDCGIKIIPTVSKMSRLMDSIRSSTMPFSEVELEHNRIKIIKNEEDTTQPNLPIHKAEDLDMFQIGDTDKHEQEMETCEFLSTNGVPTKQLSLRNESTTEHEVGIMDDSLIASFNSFLSLSMSP